MKLNDQHYYLTDPLWQRINQYAMDEPKAAFAFSQKLAAEQNWSSQFTSRAIDEYKRFIYLCCVGPHGASPPTVVDEVWHLHLTYTQNYWRQFCRDTLHREIHHNPSDGGAEESERHLKWYAETLQLYETTFGQSPPADIWPPAQPPQPQPLIIANDYFISAGSNYRFLLLLLPFLLTLLLYRQVVPFFLSGPHFLVFYSSFCIAALIVISSGRKAKKQMLQERLKQQLTTASAAEIAWVAGGKSTCVIVQINELLVQGVITHEAGEMYTINRQNILRPYTAITAALDSYATDTILAVSLIELVSNSSGIWEVKYKQLSSAFQRDKKGVTILVLMLAVARLVQGLANDKPVFLLIAITLGYAAFQHFTIGFHDAGRELICDEPDLAEPVRNDLSAEVLLTGVAAIAGIPALGGIHKHYHHDAGNGANSGGDIGASGCSSSCGGGCGGGCGGCGS